MSGCSSHEQSLLLTLVSACYITLVLPTIHYGICTMPLYFTVAQASFSTHNVFYLLSHHTCYCVCTFSGKEMAFNILVSSPIQHHTSRAHLGRPKDCHKLAD